MQVIALRPRDQESVQAIAVQDGTYRMDPRAPVGSNSSNERESDASELIQERPSRSRYPGSLAANSAHVSIRSSALALR